MNKTKKINSFLRKKRERKLKADLLEHNDNSLETTNSINSLNKDFNNSSKIEGTKKKNESNKISINIENSEDSISTNTLNNNKCFLCKKIVEDYETDEYRDTSENMDFFKKPISNKNLALLQNNLNSNFINTKIQICNSCYKQIIKKQKDFNSEEKLSKNSKTKRTSDYVESEINKSYLFNDCSNEIKDNVKLNDGFNSEDIYKIKQRVEKCKFQIYLFLYR